MTAPAHILASLADGNIGALEAGTLLFAVAAVGVALIKFQQIKAAIVTELRQSLGLPEKPGVPQPLIVAPQRTPVYSDDLVALEQRVDAKIERLDRDLQELREENRDQSSSMLTALEKRTDQVREEVGGVHDRINTVLSAVGELKGEVKQLSNRIESKQ